VRGLMLTMLMLAAVPAVADENPWVKWEQLKLLTSGESQAAKMEHLSNHGVSERGAEALVKHVADGEAELAKIDARYWADQCTRRAEFTTAESFAKFVDQWDAERAAVVAGFASNATRSMSEADEAHVAHLLDSPHGPTVSIHGERTFVDGIRSGEIPYVEVLNRRCNQ
jgi:hypothetical protein